MKNLFLPYEQALDLKELGFNEPCFQWCGDGVTYLSNNRQAKNSKYPNNNISAQPLYQQAFKWFREEHNIMCIVDRMLPSFRHFFEWRESDNKLKTEGVFFDTYEEAELACLKKLIEIVKEK